MQALVLRRKDSRQDPPLPHRRDNAVEIRFQERIPAQPVHCFDGGGRAHRYGVGAVAYQGCPSRPISVLGVSAVLSVLLDVYAVRVATVDPVETGQIGEASEKGAGDVREASVLDDRVDCVNQYEAEDDGRDKEAQRW